VTDDVTAAVKAYKGGKVEYRVDAGANVHGPVGKASFDGWPRSPRTSRLRRQRARRQAAHEQRHLHPPRDHQFDDGPGASSWTSREPMSKQLKRYLKDDVKRRLGNERSVIVLKLDKFNVRARNDLRTKLRGEGAG
jgi:hypothetical protein